MSVTSIIDEIEAERIRRGLSVTDMANSIGMAYATYYHWLEGITTPRLSQVIKVLDVLGLTLTIHRSV